MLENIFVIDITCAVDLPSSNIRGLKCVRTTMFVIDITCAVDLPSSNIRGLKCVRTTMFVIDITCAVDLSSSNIRGLKCVRKHVCYRYNMRGRPAIFQYSWTEMC